MKNLISSNFFAKHLASSRGGYSHKTTASTPPPTSVADRLLIGCSSVADRFLTMTSLCHRLAAAILLLFTLALGNAWALDIEIPLTNLKNFPLDYGLVTITNTSNTSISSNQLQVSKKTAQFRFTTLSGFYLKSISFTDANSSKNGGFTCDENSSYMSGPTENVYTYTAPNTTTTEANFSLVGNGGTAKMGTIIVTVSTSKQVERLTAFGSISDSKIPFTSSAATTNVELSVPSSNAVATSSNRISIGSGGKHLIVSGKNNKVIKSVVLTKYQQSTYDIECSSDPTGTFASNVWSTTASNVTSVDLTLTVSSTVYSQEIFVEYADGAAPSTAPSITAQPATAAASYQKDAAATALSVTATGNGTLTYQWYKNTANNNTSGTAIDGATSASYTPSTAAYGTLYYYCVVTNTESGKSGTTAKSNVSGAIMVPYPATGAATITYNVAVGTSQTTLATASKEVNSSSISNLSDIALAGEGMAVQSGGGKDNSTPKIPTPTDETASKYTYVTFDVASGYEFTISEVSTKLVAVSTNKSVKLEISDNNGGTTQSLSYSHATDSDPGTAHDFEFMTNNTYSGTVTIKLFVYGDENTYRLGKPLTISGTVATAKVVKTTVIELTDVKVNDVSISEANLTTLKTEPAYTVILTDEYASAPTVKFNKRTTITYTDDSQNVTNEVLSVTASNVSDEWKAQQEINSITYTVKAGIATTYTVNYVDEDGSTPLGSEPVAVGSHPTAAGITAEKDWHTLEGWKLNSVLTALTDVSAGAGETVTLVASYTPAYATSINIEQWILNNKKDNAAFRAVLDAQYFKYADLNDLDSLTAAKNETDRNEPYLGQKWKKASSYISFLLKSGSTVRAKFGYVGSNVNVIIGDADPVAKTASDLASPYEYENTSGADVIVKFQGTGTNTVVIKQIMIDEAIATVKLHAIVTYDANGGSFGKSSEKYTGTPLVIADATPADPSGYDFEGWHVGAVDGDLIDASAYEPTKNVTLVANYVAKPSPFSLSTLTYQIGAGAATAVGYVEGTYEYTVQLPYAHSYDAITVAATLQDATSSLKAAISQPAGVPGDATFTVVADDLSEQAYTIHFTKAPKDGVCLIKANVGNDSFTIDEEASMLSGSTEKNAVKSSSQRYPDEESGLTGWKFNSKGAYLGLVLSGDDKFLAGDVVKAYVTKVADDGVNKKLYVFSNKTTDNLNSVLLASSTDDVAQGLNSVTLPALTEVNKLYLCRGTDGNDYQNYNPYIAYVAVYRPMNPILKSMTIDGRTVTINEAAKTATCTIPYASDLAALTIVDEVVWNAAAATDAKVVTSNSGNWVIGDNTLKLTDKDGDYTIYTITLSRDVLKHTVSYNTHGGSAVASEEVEHNGYLASAPADPTKEDYLFQYWSLSDGGSEVDVTTIQVDEDKTFHAVWAPDGAIKLLNGSTVNTTDFITGVTAETVEISDVTYDCVKFSGTVSAVNGIKDKTRIIAYNAKTTQTRIQLSLYNTSTSSRTVLVKGVVEGSTDVQDLASITLGNKEQKTPDYIEFNNAANRTIYIFISSSATDVRFLQVKVIESGTALKTAGQAGYSINFNQGRPFGVKEVDHVFEGLTFQVSSDYQPVNSSYTVAKFKSSSAHVTVASPVTMTVTTANDKTYYVGTSSSATTNETAKTGASEFNLTAGTWYINAGASEVQITNISFSAPKCAEPVISSLVNSDVCDGAGYEALDGTATAADGGSFAYQWYSCDDAVKTNPVELTGEDDATYTPSADGFYYVVVTHSLTDYADNVKASDAVKVTTYAGTEIVTPLARVRKTAGADATLTVEATGKNLHYAWKECETIDGSYTDVAGAADNKSLNITVPDGVKYYKVIVTSDCGAAQESIAKVEKFVPVPQTTVSTSTTWDFTTCADAEIKLTDGTSPKKGEECLMANIEGVHYDDSFKADALIFAGEYIYRNVTGKPLGAITLKFTTDVQGMIIIRFADNGNNNRCLRVTDEAGVQYSPSSSSNSDIVTYKALVSAGDIEIMGMSQNHASTKQYVRIFSLEFFPYNHRRTGVVGNLGTICWPYNVPVANRKGADFFSIDYFNSSHVIFIEEDGELQAGRPYFFQYTDENMLIQNGETHVDDPSNYRGMYGTFTTLSAGSATDAILQGNVMLNNNNLYYAPAGCWLNAYRAYLKWDEVEALAPYVEPAGAPLRRRMYINMEHKTPTDLENIDVLNNLDGNKFIKDGKLYILRNGHLYNAQGVRVQ